MPLFNNPPYYITAYGLAVKRGFKGSIDEWLASLKGEPGPGVKLRYNAETGWVEWAAVDTEDWQELFALEELADDVNAALKAQLDAAVAEAAGSAQAAANDAVRAQQCIERAALSAQAADASAQLAEDAQTAAAGSAQTAANDAVRAQQCMERAALSAQAADASAQLAEEIRADVRGVLDLVEEKANAADLAKDEAAAAARQAADRASSAGGYALAAEQGAKRAEAAAERAENGSGQKPYYEPADGDTPLVFFTGVKPTTKDNVLAEMVYISKGTIIKAYVKIKCQGSSSMSYAKKNFTVTLYQDEARTIPLYLEFKGWGIKVNKFVLKADWIDHSHSRNVCTARIWKDIVESRPDYDTLPTELKNAPGHGAVVGFPIAVYYNGNYEGLYNWNIGKDPWMWGMDEGNPNHAMLCAEVNNEGTGNATMCNFRGPLWGGVDGTGWSVEIGTNSTALKNSLNSLIAFVANSDEEAFVNGIEEYLDVQSAMDYYCLCYSDCGLDGLGKNMTIGTYDGKKWYFGAYDLDCTWLLYWNGSQFVPATYRCPEDYQENANLLFDKLERCMTTRLKTNYQRLRSGPLSVSNIIRHFERYIGEIGSERYADDLEAYPAIPQGTTNNIRQIRAAVRDRLAYTDAEFSAMTEPVHCTGISLDKNTLAFSGAGAQTLVATVTPDGCTDAIKWYSSNVGVAVVQDGTVTAVGSGDAVITAECGDYSATCNVTVTGISEIVPLYPMVNASTGFADNGATATMSVTNGNHVKIEFAADVLDLRLVISNVSQNTTVGDRNNHTAKEDDPVLFHLNVGDVLSYKLKNISGPNGVQASLLMRGLDNAYSEDLTNSAWTFGTNTSKEGTKTATVSTDLRRICMWGGNGTCNAGDVIEFDLELYVNDVLYIGRLDEVHCSGITLDKTQLTFDGEGTQTITATVTPADTTDKIIWVSGDEGIATVDNGVVTPIRNGNTTITAMCGNQSASCGVSVSGIADKTLMYSLPEATTFDGTNYIDTEVQLFAEDKPFTVVGEWTHTTSSFAANTHVVLHCLNEVDPWPGFLLAYSYYPDYLMRFDINQGKSTTTRIADDGVTRDTFTSIKFAIRKNSDGTFTIARKYPEFEDVFTSTLNGLSYVQVNQNLLIGCYQASDGTKGRFAKGIMNDCEVYNRALSDDEVSAYLIA